MYLYGVWITSTKKQYKKLHKKQMYMYDRGEITLTRFHQSLVVSFLKHNNIIHVFVKGVFIFKKPGFYFSIYIPIFVYKMVNVCIFECWISNIELKARYRVQKSLFCNQISRLVIVYILLHWYMFQLNLINWNLTFFCW